MKHSVAGVLLAGLAVACSPAGKGDDQASVQGGKSAAGQTTETASVLPEAQAAVQDGSARISQYSNLKTCKTLEQNEDEAWAELLCQGQGGYQLRILAGDAREDVVVIPPAGKPEQSLDIPGVTRKGGFSSLKDVVEWRGTQAKGTFKPSAMIMRFNVQENPDVPKDTSFLLAIRLDGAMPCVTALVPPGPEQNEKARQAADNPAACLKSYYDEHPGG